MAITLLLLALVGVPKAFGWREATVNTLSTGTFYPQTVNTLPGSPAPLLHCEQTSGTAVPTTQINLTKGMNAVTRSYFSCTNNWGTDVSFTITISDNSGTGLSISNASRTISPGQTKCVPATFTTNNGNGGNVLYSVTATATDLSATLQFAGSFRTPGNDSTQCSFP